MYDSERISQNEQPLRKPNTLTETKDILASKVQHLINKISRIRNNKGAGEAIRAIVEEPVIEPFDPEKFKQKIEQLERDYPGHVQVLSEGTILFHVSKDPDRFAQENKFDQAEVTVSGTGIFVTDKPGTKTNIRISLQRPTVFFDIKGDIMQSIADLTARNDKAPKGLVAAATAAGFDGSVTQNPDAESAFTSRDSKEFHIFSTAIDTINGGIAPYSSVEK